jgi:hypothetical protein
MNKPPGVPIETVRAAALAQFKDLVAELVPGGRFNKDYYYAGSWEGGKGQSFKAVINPAHHAFGRVGDWAESKPMLSGPFDLVARAAFGLEPRLRDGTTDRQAFFKAKRWLEGRLGLVAGSSAPSPTFKANAVVTVMQTAQHAQEGSVKEVYKPFLLWPGMQRAMTPERREAFAAWRGLSRSYVDGLVRDGILGAIDNGWAFALNHKGKLKSARMRVNRPDGKASWFYPEGFCPSKNLGITDQPLTRRLWGEHGRNRFVIAAESPFDAMAAEHTLKLEGRGDTAWIATCGAQKVRQLEVIPQRCQVLLVAQNDEAGESWLSNARDLLKSHAAVWVLQVPAPFKDLNDWTRAGATEEEVRKAFKKEGVGVALPASGALAHASASATTKVHAAQSPEACLQERAQAHFARSIGAAAASAACP